MFDAIIREAVDAKHALDDTRQTQNMVLRAPPCTRHAGPCEHQHAHMSHHFDVTCDARLQQALTPLELIAKLAFPGSSTV